MMGPRDTAGDDELLTLSSLKRENKIRRRRKERKLRKLALMRENQRLDFEDKLYLVNINKAVDTSRRDMTNRKTFTK